MKNEKDIFDFIVEDDGAFFEQCLNNLTDEELTRFLEENPDLIDSL